MSNEWLALAQQLPVGGHAKHPHYCGDGRPLVVFHNETKWSAYCHRCGNFPPVFKPLPTLQERLAAVERERLQEEAVATDTRPPMPAVYDMAEWPLEARVWLFKAGLSHAEVSQSGAYYHPPTRRVVFPVFEDGRLTFWQARRIFGTTAAKYLSQPGGRECTLPLFGGGYVIALVEDLLSAYKIGTAGCKSLCLMGTKLLPIARAWLIANPQYTVAIWLDPDGPGRSSAAEIKNQLLMFGIESQDILTERDPKFHSKQEIRNVFGRIAVANDAKSKGLRQAAPGSELACIGSTDRHDHH
ncbi:DNA primase [Pseudomonas phage Bf7]|uniref:DNA primase n=1 Tax=Pseudomonas phage Bf7 TaxID=1100790 RepID=H2ELV4_9CAUD|nr:DNA primase [Pseudomonas phage Bf7]AEX65856.1 DNA primase [Pseudomonas phage Bf7]